jgi:putative colanic acid biosynthesis acetyltransferase WcaF
MTDHDQFHSERIFQRLDTTAKYPYPFSEYARKLCWFTVRNCIFRWIPGRIRGARRGLLRVFGANIAAGVNIAPSVRIRHPWLFTIGEHSAIGDNVEIYNLGPIMIGEHTVISQNAHLCAGTHDYTKPDLPLIRASITIGSGVWICADAFIGPNVTIGNNALIAARAVVTKDVPANVIVGGNPAKVIKHRPMNNEQSASPRAAADAREAAPS